MTEARSGGGFVVECLFTAFNLRGLRALDGILSNNFGMGRLLYSGQEFLTIRCATTYARLKVIDVIYITHEKQIRESNCVFGKIHCFCFVLDRLRVTVFPVDFFLDTF
jgi:hypothetical protein